MLPALGCASHSLAEVDVGSGTFVSVVAESIPWAKTATLAFLTLRTVPSASLLITTPRTSWEALAPLPGILTTRTLSTLKLAASLGQTSMQALAIRGVSQFSAPYILLDTDPLIRASTCKVHR